MSGARLLDLTRSLRRAGRVATGVDRVERAYLAQFLKDDVDCFALFRTAFGYVLLDRSGMQAFRACLEGSADWSAADILSRLPRGRDQVLSQAETDIRKRAVARCVPSRLRQMLSRHLPEGYEYYNIGHSNLTERVLRCVGYAGGEVHVMVHDVIPLEFPQFQRPGTVRPFEDKMKRVSRMAARVIYNSDDTRSRAEALMQTWGRVPPSIVAHLGTIEPVVDATELPDILPPDGPYFVTIGTIEPRKNHAFLLDLWDELGPGAPPLLICGSRGWNNDAVFDRLDVLPPTGPVVELNGLSDGAVGALVQGSAGVLFPSLAEGFGLPPVEALSLGARVLCNDLPVLQEILGDAPSFVSVFDRENWLVKVRSWENSPPDADRPSGFDPSNWTDHFKTVLRLP
ncbi:MAG: glycosyltransferase [Sulfitobacter sp.]